MAFRISSFVLIYFFLKNLMVEENIFNFVALLFFLVFLFKYKDSLRMYFILILSYHSFYLSFSFFYNLLDHELFTVSTETLLGINFNSCFSFIYSSLKDYHSPSLCNGLKQMLFLNLIFRLKYFMLIRIDFLKEQHSQIFPFKQLGFLYNFAIKFNIFIVLLLYASLSFVNQSLNYLYVGLGVLSIFIFFSAVCLKTKFSSYKQFKSVANKAFFVLLALNFIMFVLVYIIRIYQIYKTDVLDEAQY